MADSDQPPGAHRWDHAPLEEGLHDARTLSVSVVDRITRDGWEQLARHAGIPKRRWRRFHPIGTEPVVQLVDGQPAFDAAAWERFVSLVPGAVALPTRTAASFGIARSALRPPDRRWRLGDLLAARRRRRRTSRAMRTLEADHARHSAAVDAAVTAALAAGDDGTSFEALPPYALAARLEQLLDHAAGWSIPQLVDLLAATATARVMQLLVARDRTPAQALLEAASLQSGGGAQVPEHLAALAGIEMTSGPERERVIAAWRDSASGWHAMRELLLEAPPLRDLGEGVASLVPSIEDARADPPQVADDDEELAVAVERARSLTARRERLARDRALHSAGLRAITWSLARAMQRDGMLDHVDAAFSLALGDLVRLARGVEVAVASHAAPTVPHQHTAGSRPGEVVNLSSVELRGIPASGGSASGRVVVLDAPAPDVDVDGAVLVCRSTDPAWMPLLMRCAGLVTERGGPLSHAAIVARELRLPTVVAVRGALDAAARSSRASVDGDAGTVTLSPAR